MSKLIGGKIIGTGTYGCVHKPQMECADDKLNATPDAVSKIMLKLDAEKELGEFNNVTRADPSLTMHLGTPTKCPVKNNDENKIAFSGCKDLHNKRRSIYPDDYALLIMKDGGQDITDFAASVYVSEVTPENQNKIELFWLEVSRLFYGLKVFEGAGLIHRDINQNNIVYNINTNRLNFIDFGFMTRKDHFNTAANSNEINNQSDWSRPWETSQLNKSEFNKIVFDNAKYNYQPLPVTLRPKTYDYFFWSIMPLMSSYDKLNEMNSNMSAAYYKMKEKHENLDRDRFLNKSIDTIDSYGVGLALLYALTRSGKFLEPDLYDKLNVLFTNMINPYIYDRYDVDRLIAEYRRIMEGSGLLEKHNKHYDDNFLLVNNAVEVPPPVDGEELLQTPIMPPPEPKPVVPELIVTEPIEPASGLPGGRFRPRSRKSSKMSKTTRHRKSSKRTRSRKANEAKRSHKKR
jgi:serine/threonine protein kinase